MESQIFGIRRERNSDKKGGLAFSSCTPTIWNDLPLDAWSALSVDIFKNRFETFLINL